MSYVTPCSLVEIRRFGETFCLHLGSVAALNMEAAESFETVVNKILHGVTSHKAAFFPVTGMTISNHDFSSVRDVAEAEIRHRSLLSESRYMRLLLLCAHAPCHTLS
jgi:hypothetical protein